MSVQPPSGHRKFHSRRVLGVASAGSANNLQNVVVPSAATYAKIEVWGAGGSGGPEPSGSPVAGTESVGGGGAYASAFMPLNGVNELYVVVGRRGEAGEEQKEPIATGGEGATSGGGGATVVLRKNNEDQYSPFIVAGGGGGAGLDYINGGGGGKRGQTVGTSEGGNLDDDGEGGSADEEKSNGVDMLQPPTYNSLSNIGGHGGNGTAGGGGGYGGGAGSDTSGGAGGGSYAPTTGIIKNSTGKTGAGKSELSDLELSSSIGNGGDPEEPGQHGQVVISFYSPDDPDITPGEGPTPTETATPVPPKKKWYTTWWFYTIVAVVGLLIIGLIIYLVARGSKKTKVVEKEEIRVDNFPGY